MNSELVEVRILNEIVPTSTRYWFRFCTNLTNIDGIKNLNLSKDIDMNRMFWNCSSLTNLELSSFNTANVTDMQGMFDGCSSLTSLDLSSFNTANVTGMHRMFAECTSLTDLNLTNFDTVSVTNMTNIFCECLKMKKILVGENWKKPEAGSSQFFRCGVSDVTYVSDETN